VAARNRRFESRLISFLMVRTDTAPKTSFYLQPPDMANRSKRTSLGLIRGTFLLSPFYFVAFFFLPFTFVTSNSGLTKALLSGRAWLAHCFSAARE
jgi:hypothetical protein